MTPAPRYVRDRHSLDEVLDTAKQSRCPHCRRAGMLVGHGLLRGYAERGGNREIRGRRLRCSQRFRRAGCGRTFSVLLATVLAGFAVRTPTLSALLGFVIGGVSRKAAWERLAATAGAPGLCLRSCYRLWARLEAAQSGIRTALSTIAPPPPCADPHPLAQVLAHLHFVAGAAACVLAAFQLALQRGLFG